VAVHVENREETSIVRVSGRLDSASSPELDQIVRGRLDEGCQKLVFDFSDLDFVSSAGLRVVLSAGKRLRASRGKLAFAGLRPNVREVFSMSGFLTLFTVLETVDEAVAAVA